MQSWKSKYKSLKSLNIFKFSIIPEKHPLSIYRIFQTYKCFLKAGLDRVLYRLKALTIRNSVSGKQIKFIDFINKWQSVNNSYTTYLIVSAFLTAKIIWSTPSNHKRYHQVEPSEPCRQYLRQVAEATPLRKIWFWSSL